MGRVIEFPTRKRNDNQLAKHSFEDGEEVTGQVLIFTGVRYETFSNVGDDEWYSYIEIGYVDAPFDHFEGANSNKIGALRN